jgi:hypothetical protein
MAFLCSSAESGLNIAEIELNVITGQCLKRRMNNIEVRKEALV